MLKLSQIAREARKLVEDAGREVYTYQDHMRLRCGDTQDEQTILYYWLCERIDHTLDYRNKEALNAATGGRVRRTYFSSDVDFRRARILRRMLIREFNLTKANV